MAFTPSSERSKYQLSNGFYWPIGHWEAKAPAFNPSVVRLRPFPQFHSTLSSPPSSAYDSLVPFTTSPLVHGVGYWPGTSRGQTAPSDPPHQNGQSGTSLIKKAHPLSNVTLAESVEFVVENMTKVSAKPADTFLANKKPYHNLDPAAFSGVNKRIRLLAERTLPGSPHLLTPGLDVMPPDWRNPYENLGTPFEVHELKKRCQYMTMLSNPPNRGVTMAHGGWEDEESLYNADYRSRSGTATPGSEREAKKNAAVKLAFKDYKAAMADGTLAEKMNQKKLEAKKAEAKRLSEEEEIKARDLERSKSASQHARPIGAETVRPANEIKAMPHPLSGHALPPKPPPPIRHGKDQNRADGARNPGSDSRLGFGLVPGSGSGSSISPSLLRKRSFEGPGSSTPGKRTKFDQSGNSEQQRIATSSNALSTAVDNFSRPEKQGVKAMISEQVPGPNPASAKSASSEKSSASAKKPVSSSKNFTSTGKSRALNTLPPLLSPLPANLTSPDAHGETSQPQTHFGDPGLPESESTLSLPPLLSPTLPPQIEDALRKLKTTSANARSSVEVRYENSRQADAPGVAKKKPKPRSAGKSRPADHSNGKKHAAVENSESEPTDAAISRTEYKAGKESFIVRLKYSKRNAKNIKGLLAFGPRPNLSKVPSSASSSKRVAAPAQSDKKRSHAEDDHSEQSAKRHKVPGHLDTSKSNTSIVAAAQSPGLPPPRSAAKATLATPRRGDAMKSVEMGRVNSSNGYNRTPQGATISTPRPTLTSTPKAASMSTPNSVEKPRGTSNNETKIGDIELMRVTHSKNVNLGTALKRRMDQLLKTKEANPGPVSEADAKLGAVVAVECIAAYMAGFHAQDGLRKLERKQNAGDHWEQLLSLLPFVASRSKSHPELHLLAVVATAICCEALSACHTERLASDVTSTPDYLKFKDIMVNNNRNRQAVWREYHDLAGASSSAAVDRVDAGAPIPEVLSLISHALGDLSAKAGIAWDKKIDF
ncbi:MAG: hypothetical protein M1818_003924 [Claussenomyces sp. TS43310]|nr:MAG: hypothetical protein M1818_003924 [Claussenomyces sp. TS43310]